MLAKDSLQTLGCLGTIVMALVVGAFVLLVALPSIEDSRAAEAQAAAEREWARVAGVEAQAARDRETNLHREQMFMLWTVALSRHSGALVAVAGVLGAVAGIFVVRWLERREVF